MEEEQAVAATRKDNDDEKQDEAAKYDEFGNLLDYRDDQGNLIGEEAIIEDVNERKNYARAEIQGKNARDLA